MSSTTLAVLQQINQDQHIDIATIAERLHISPSIILDHFAQLNRYGLIIDVDPQKGYRLQQPISMINPYALQTKKWEYPVLIDYFVSIPSTNDYLMGASSTNGHHVCLAEHQTQGRGRLGRPWLSPFAENIYLSIKTTLHIKVDTVTTISLTIAVIIVQILTKLFKTISLSIKWPNDVYLQGKKLSGNLIEIRSTHKKQIEIIIGIGLNVNMVQQPQIDQPWTSLRQELGTLVDRTSLTIALIEHVLEGIAIFEQKGFAAFKDRYQAHDYLLGKELNLALASNTGNAIQGIGAGVNDKGQLMVITDQGLQCFSTGEAAIIKN